MVWRRVDAVVPIVTHDIVESRIISHPGIRGVGAFAGSQLLPTTLRALWNPASFPHGMAGSGHFRGIPIVTRDIVDIAESHIIFPLYGGELALLRNPNCYPQHCGHCGIPHHFIGTFAKSQLLPTTLRSQLLPTTLRALRNTASFRQVMAGSGRFCGIPIVAHNIVGIVESRSTSPLRGWALALCGIPIVTHDIAGITESRTISSACLRHCGIPQPGYRCCPFRNVVLWVTIGGPTLPTMPWGFGTGGWEMVRDSTTQCRG
jgi:hypothetical protein